MKLVRNLAATALAVVTAATVTSCTTMVGGHARLVPASRHYEGPELATSDPRAVSNVVPGIEVSVGVGDDAVTCTMGWTFATEDHGGFLLAGQCGRSGPGSPVYMNYRDGSGTKKTYLGYVERTTYKPSVVPYNPNVTVVFFDATPENKSIPLIKEPYSAASLMLPFTTSDDFYRFARRDTVNLGCWYSISTTRGDTGTAQYSCGRFVGGSGDELLIDMEYPEDFTTTHYGAPVVWRISEQLVVPLGVIGNRQGNRLTVDMVAGTLSDIGGKLLTDTVP